VRWGYCAGARRRRKNIELRQSVRIVLRVVHGLFTPKENNFMRMKLHAKIPVRIGIAAVAIAALAAFAASTARAQQGVLFSDNFDVSAADQGINAEIGAPRQSGAFVTKFGSVSYYQNPIWGGNVLSPTAWTPGSLVNWDGGFVSTQQNFGGVFSQGGLTVEYDLNAMLNAWGWMGVGQVGQEYFANAAYGADPQPGAGLITSTDGSVSSWQFFRNDQVPPAASGTLPVSIADQVFHHYKAVFTDPTDGNPFDGQGETDVTYYIQDGDGVYQAIGETQIFPDNGGLPSAVVTLQALNQHSQWDNLKVTGNVGAFANPWLGGSAWNTPGNWTTGVAPNGAGTVAAFLDRVNGGPVLVDAPTTVGSIVFAGGTDYITGYSLVSDGVDTYPITLDNSPNLSAATIDVVSGINAIYVPLVLNNSNLAITITPTSAPTGTNPTTVEALTISAGLTANGNNVSVTCPVNGNWWEFPTQRPAGLFTVDTVPVTGIGTLALNYVNAHISDIAVEAEQVTGGTSSLYLEGGSLFRPGTTINPSVDVLKFDLSRGSTYTASVGTTLTTSNLTSFDGTGVFTLDGGTLALTVKIADAGQVGYDTDAGANAQLSHFYLGPNGGTIDTGYQWNGLNQVVENLGETAGDLTITSAGVLVIEHDNTYTSNTLITNRAMAYTAKLGAFSTGDVFCINHGKVVFEANHGGGVVANNFSFDSRGDNGGTAIEAPNGINFTGTITLAGGTPGDQTSYPDFLALWGETVTFSGKITGTNGVVIGNVASQGTTKQLGNILFTGTESNDYTGDTVVAGAFLGLGKDNSGIDGRTVNDAVAVAGKLILDPMAKNWAYASAVLLKPNQTNNNTVVVMSGPGHWLEFALNGNSTTVGGLSTITADGLSVVTNTQGLSTAVGYPFYGLATTPATLTIDTKTSTDNFSWTGYMANAIWFPSETGTLALVKTGPGTQTFVPSGVWGRDGFVFTGGTTVKEGVLDISALNTTFNDLQPANGLYGGFTKNGTISLEGGTLLASGLLQDTIIRGSLTSGTLEAGGTTYPILEVNKAVDIAAAVIDDGHSLSLTSGGVNYIDTVTGTGGSLYVTGAGTTLTSLSINVDTLQIGGVAPVSYVTISVPPATAVPEPSTLVLLVLAGLGALAAWRRR
jgi:hypothetical protein